jgi:uncharacterized membrane protein YhdT
MSGVLVMLVLTIAGWLLTTWLVSVPIAFIHFIGQIPNWFGIAVIVAVILWGIDE